MPSEKTILVTGATGRQGGAVARHLLEAGFGVRILARNPAKPAAVALQAQGAELCQGDMEKADTLAPAVAGVYGVFSVQNYWEKGVGAAGEVRQARNLADAARAAGVQHFVQASVAEAARAPGVEHFACKTEIEHYIDWIGLPRTFVGEVFYMDNFLDPKLAPMLLPILAGGLSEETRLHLLSVEDIGAVVTEIFKLPEEFIGRKIDLAGDALTVGQMRAAYEKVSGRRARQWALPSFLLRLISRETHRQLQWNDTDGWRFSVEAVRERHPFVTNFETFVSRNPLPRL